MIFFYAIGNGVPPYQVSLLSPLAPPARTQDGRLVTQRKHTTFCPLLTMQSFALRMFFGFCDFVDTYLLPVCRKQPSSVCKRFKIFVPQFLSVFATRANCEANKAGFGRLKDITCLVAKTPNRRHRKKKLIVAVNVHILPHRQRAEIPYQELEPTSHFQNDYQHERSIGWNVFVSLYLIAETPYWRNDGLAVSCLQNAYQHDISTVCGTVTRR